MLSSFYGGKQGRSLHIVARYDSVHQMVENFLLGPAYTDVAFDEYVIIDTIYNNHDPSNLENGLIFRRGYDFNQAFNEKGEKNSNKTIAKDDRTSPSQPISFTADEYNQEMDYIQDDEVSMPSRALTGVAYEIPIYYSFKYKLIPNPSNPEEPIVEIDEDTYEFNEDKWERDWNDYVGNPGGGAIYIGQIVGPEGGKAEIQLLSWEAFQNYMEQAPVSEQINHYTFFTEPQPGYDANKIRDDGFEYEDGYDREGCLDSIQYGYCVIRDDHGNIDYNLLSFSFPYVVFEMHAHGISAYPSTSANFDENTQTYTDSITNVTYRYNENTKLWEYDHLIKENDVSVNHKYYKYYDIQIPKGVHGQDIANMQVLSFYQNGSGFEQIFDINTGNYLNIITNGEDIDHNPILKDNVRNQFLTYVTQNYDKTEAGELSPAQKIAPYKIITDVARPKLSPYNNIERNNPQELQFQYTWGQPTKITYPVIERIWNQANDDNQNIDINNNTLKADHIYALMSHENQPRDLGFVRKITKIDRGTVDSNNPNILPPLYTYYNYNLNGTIANVSEQLNVSEIDEIRLFGDNVLIHLRDTTLTGFPTITLDDQGNITTSAIGTTTYLNLGTTIKGNHVIGNFAELNDLKQTYPNGFGLDVTTEGRAGWVATVGPDENQNYTVYAFNYFNTDSEPGSGWYAINNFSAKPTSTILVAPDDGQGAPDSPDASLLSEYNGVWLIESEYNNYSNE